MFSFNVFGAGIFAIALFLIGLMLLGWSFGIFAAGVIFRFGMRMQVLAWSVAFLIQPFSAVFYPLSSLPPAMQKISLVFPTTHIFEGFRYAVATNKIAWGNLFYAFTLNFILMALALWYFKKSVDRAKKTGLLAKPND